MTMPDDNPDGYEKCNLLNTKLENFKQVPKTSLVTYIPTDDNMSTNTVLNI